VIHGDIGAGRLIPLPLLGEGVARLASLILAIANAENGVVLVDEIENGVHYSIMGRVWEAIKEAVRRFNVQLFATTHSRECIEAAHAAFSKDEKYDFRFHRLERVRDSIKVKSYDQEALSAAIQVGLEVR